MKTPKRDVCYQEFTLCRQISSHKRHHLESILEWGWVLQKFIVLTATRSFTKPQKSSTPWCWWHPLQVSMQLWPAFSSPSPNIIGFFLGWIWWDEYLLWVQAVKDFVERQRERKRLKKKTSGGKSWCRHFWSDWRSSLQQVIHSEREAQVPPLLLPAQVYDNPNKLWCAAQTLKTLIGTKSNRLCLSGQRESGCVCVCVLLSFPTINFSLSLNPTSLLVHLPISVFFSPLFLLLSFGSTCNFPFIFLCPFCSEHFLWSWLDKFRRQRKKRVRSR